MKRHRKKQDPYTRDKRRKFKAQKAGRKKYNNRDILQED